MDTVVSLRNVNKQYRMGDHHVHALRDITLDIYANRFTVLSGASGSGKTTLLNVLGCIARPNSGLVTVAGQDMQQLNDNKLTDFRSRNIGFIFQNFNLLQVLSAYENIEYPLLMSATPVAERRERVRMLLAAVGLEKQGAHRPNQLSGGQQQRVAIARALVTQPSLVLADEPTANLDSKTGLSIIELMRSMQRKMRTSFVFSSHDPQVLSAADDVIVIRDGGVAETRRMVLQ